MGHINFSDYSEKDRTNFLIIWNFEQIVDSISGKEPPPPLSPVNQVLEYIPSELFVPNPSSWRSFKMWPAIIRNIHIELVKILQIKSGEKQNQTF